MSGSKPVVVELIGMPASGKTTLVPAVRAACAAHGLVAGTTEELARSAVRNSPGLARLSRHGPPALRSAIEWGLFRVAGAAGIAAAIVGRPGWWRILANQRRRPVGADRRARRVAHWLLRLIGDHRFLRRRLPPDHALILDEGFAHRTVQLFTSPVERPDITQIARYVSMVPAPDLLVHIEVEPSTAIERLRDREPWPWLARRPTHDLDSYLHHADAAIHATLDAARRRGWNIVVIPNHQRDVSANLALTTESITRALASVTGSVGASRPSGPSRPGQLARLTRTRLHSGQIDIGDVDRVLDRFALRRAGQPRTLGSGVRNPVMLVDTDRGPMVLKRYPERWQREALIHEHSIHRRLSAAGFDVPTLQSTPDGASIVEIDDRLHAVSAHLDGWCPAGRYLSDRYRRDFSHASGKVMARFHRELQDFQPDGTHHLGPGPETNEAPPATTPAEPYRSQLARLVSLTPADGARDAWSYLARHAGAIGEAIEELDESLAGMAADDTVIHGDWGYHNHLITRDGRLALLDFELARRDRRLVDLAILQSRIRPDHFQAFVEGYRSVAPVDISGLTDVSRYHHLTGAVRSWTNYVEHGEDRRLRTAQARAKAGLGR